MDEELIVKCPACGMEGRWFAGDYGPFCCERCRLVDLGKWLNEEQKISSPLDAESLEDLEEGEFFS